MTDYPELLRLLTEHGVEFIIVGGAAAVIHGSSRLTHLEVVYRRSPENIARLTNALKAQAPYLRAAPPGLPFEGSDPSQSLFMKFNSSVYAVPLLNRRGVRRTGWSIAHLAENRGVWMF